jgi:hypothetical protein
MSRTGIYDEPTSWLTPFQLFLSAMPCEGLVDISPVIVVYISPSLLLLCSVLCVNLLASCFHNRSPKPSPKPEMSGTRLYPVYVAE